MLILCSLSLKQYGGLEEMFKRYHFSVKSQFMYRNLNIQEQTSISLYTRFQVISLLQFQCKDAATCLCLLSLIVGHIVSF